jgi:succinate dehydrogenase/fumarate reductase cytochrome b subunit
MIWHNTEGVLVGRPLSPFILERAYKPQISSITATMQRITECALWTETLLLTLRLVFVMISESALSTIRSTYTYDL